MILSKLIKNKEKHNNFMNILNCLVQHTSSRVVLGEQTSTSSGVGRGPL